MLVASGKSLNSLSEASAAVIGSGMTWPDVVWRNCLETAQETKFGGGCRVDGVESCRGRWMMYLDRDLLSSNFFSFLTSV